MKVSADGEEPAAVGPNAEAPPGIRSLLDFAAWVVFTQEAQSAQQLPAAWLRGRGGFLADTLTAVQDAAIRVQVRACPPPCQTLQPVRAIIELCVADGPAV